MLMMKIRFLAVFTLSLLIALACRVPGFAQDNEEEQERSVLTLLTDTFDGYIENATAVRLNKLDRFTKIKNSLRLSYENNFGDHVNLKLDGLGAYNAVYDVEDLDVDQEDSYRAYVDIREATLNLFFDTFDLRLGKQQIIWEITDGLRVLDIINPLDLKEFILNDFENLRIPLWMVNLTYYFSDDYSLQSLIIWDTSFTEFPHAGSEFAFSTPALPGGFQLLVNDDEELDVSAENTRYGLRFKGLLGNWDVTLNYLYTWNNIPVRKKALNLETGTLSVSPEYERMQLIGGSIVNVLFDTVVRFELAGKLGLYFDVDDMTVPDMVVEKDTIEYALAFERDLWDITWILQGSQQYILDYDQAISSEKEVNTVATLRASKALNYEETLEFEVLGMYRFADDGYLIRPKLTYDLTDALRLSAGLDIFGGGDKNGFFGQFDEKDQLYAELRYSF
ncbi:hypothetical protein CSA57_10320 [candidate division KSB3 bacterium]|nr:MAG: hypothetical protein CSA57_10320 [candidate division KSB3 bacterium]